MKALLRIFSLSMFFGGLLWIGAGSAAPLIRTQALCNNGNDFCIQFFSSGTIPTIRAFSFVAPSAGTAQFAFNGSLFCLNVGSTPVLVDLDGEIVPMSTTTPDDNGPGGVRYVAELGPAGAANSIAGTVPFNLTATRVQHVTAGAQKAFFRLVRNRMDASAKCFVINAAFSVVFVP